MSVRFVLISRVASPERDMHNRRQFLGALTGPAALAVVGSELSLRDLERIDAAFADSDQLTPQAVAADEARWFEVQQAFTIDRSQINLNNGGVSPAPAIVQTAHKQRLDFSNQNSTRNLWDILEPQKENVRAGLARMFGSHAEEIAITRNASESLETCLLGFDLERGDEILTSDQDYPRMRTTIDTLVRRRGLVKRLISLPVPCEDKAEVVKRFEGAINGRTRLLLMSHVINVTGQILPVREVVAMARKHDVPVIVDGAHAIAHLEFKRDDLDCDYYGSSLHKWLFAPHGTGMLYVRREKIAGLWPLMAAAASQDADIRKYEEIGTHPAAQILSIGEALAFHNGMGAANKAARMRYLRDRWAVRLSRNDRVRLNTSLKPEFSCGVANFTVAGLDMPKLREHLWAKYKIWTTYVGADLPESCWGLRITPSVYTTLDELDRFCEAVETVIRDGLPA
jgi:selenocysteine lyase/cysteine desulfurase